MSDEYQVGGSLNVDATTYVVRQADSAIYQALLKGEFCYVFNCRQMGKSSLRVRVKHRLEKEGYACVSLDMTNIGSQTISTAQWYKSIASELWRGFNLIKKVKLKAWWEEQVGLSPVQQLSLFISDLILPTVTAEKIFIFIDEIDSVLSLDFSTDDFFALIRYFYNARAENSQFNRLSFALFGVATPSDLISDRTRTPFNIGRAIELTGFTQDEATPLVKGLQDRFKDCQLILREILSWTGGQPFLTQKLCKLALERSQYRGDCPFPGTEIDWVKDLVTEKIIDNWESQDEPEHLKTIRDRLLNDECRASRILGLGEQILRNGFIPADDSCEQRYLLLSNLVIKKNGQLIPRNLIYQQIFNLKWLQQQQDKLRPFGKEVELWMASNCQDQSRLLRGQALKDAQAWAKDRSLSDLDYHFLSASQELAEEITKQKLEAARLLEIEARLSSEKCNNKQQKILIATLSIALALATGLGLYARKQYQKAIASEQKIAESQRKTLVSVIEAIANSSEALFASEQRLEALTQAVKAKVELQKLDGVKPELTAKVDRDLRRATYGIQETNRLSGHKGPVWAVDFSPDNQFILSAGEDNTAKLWKLNGTLLTTYEGHKAGVWSVDFSQDQTKLLTASSDKTIKLWDINGQLLKTFRGHQGQVWEVEYGLNDRAFASASSDKTIKLWTPEGELITTLTGHKGEVWAIDFSNDGKILASASDDKTVKLWDLEQSIALKKPVLLATLSGHKDGVTSVDFSPDNQTIASASYDRTLILWDVSDPTQPVAKKTLSGHQDRVMSVAYNHITSEIISASDDRTIKIWSPKGTLITTLKGHRDRIFALGVRSDGDMIASSGFDQTIRLWQPQNNLLRTLEGHSDSVWHTVYSSYGWFIASGSRDSTIKLWTPSGRFLKTLEGHRDRVHDVAFHPNNKLIASGSDDLTVKLWHPDGRLLKTLKGHTGEVFSAVFSPDGNYLVTASENNEIKIWNLQGELIRTFNGHQTAIIELAFSHDGTVLASASRDNTVKLWRWSENPTIITTLKGHQSVVYSVASSPKDQTWVTGSWDGTIKLWSFDGQELATFQGHESEVNQVSFSPDGQTIASAGADKTVRLWNLQGEQLLILERHTAKVWSVDFSPDGQTLISAGDDRQVIIWDLERILGNNYFEYACNWIKDYLKTNPEVAPGDRLLCD